MDEVALQATTVASVSFQESSFSKFSRLQTKPT